MTVREPLATMPGGHVREVRAPLLVAAGAPELAGDQVARLRTAVADDRHGPALEAARDAAEGGGLDVHPGRHAPLKRAPRGYPADHPRVTLLRWKGVEASARPPIEDADLPARALATWNAAGPLLAWLAAHVGPSAVPPEQCFRR